MRYKIIIVLLILLFSFDTYAVTSSDYQLPRKDSDNYYSEALVGSAQIQLDSIRWKSTTPLFGEKFHLYIDPYKTSTDYPLSGYGFTGSFSQGVPDPTMICPIWEVANVYEACKGKWVYDPSSVSLPEASQTSPSLSLFFAPTKKGEFTSNIGVQIGNYIENVPLKSIGTMDSSSSPIFGLSVAGTGKNAIAINSGDTINVNDVDKSITLSITPSVNTLNATHPLKAEADKIKYIKVRLLIKDEEISQKVKDQECYNQGAAFQDKPQSKRNFSEADYYHDLDKVSNLCERSYSFLVAKGKPFQFTATKLRNTNVKTHYVFYIEGHYDPSKPQEFTESYKSFYLSASSGGTLPTNQSPTAFFSIKPLSPTIGTTVELDGSASSDDGIIKSYNWTIDPQLAQPIPKIQKPSISFTIPGPYSISLTVTDDKGTTSTQYSQSITVSDTSTPTSFTLTTNVLPVGAGTIVSKKVNGDVISGDVISGTQLTLTATPNSGFEFVSWSGDCNGVSTTTNPLTITKNTTCTANFNQTQTQQPTDLTACFEIQSDPSDSFQKTLDASCTKPNTSTITYNWIIYHLDGNGSVSSTTSIGEKPLQKLKAGKNVIVLVASAGDKTSVLSKPILVPTISGEFSGVLTFSVMTNATKISLDAGLSTFPAQDLVKYIKYIWLSRNLNNKLDISALKADNIDLTNPVQDVITLIVYNDATYIKSVSQVVTLLSETEPVPEIKGISPKLSDMKLNLDEQSLIFELDGSTSKDSDNTPDPTKGIKQYKWKWEVSSNSSDLPPADKSSSESPSFFINKMFLGESQQFTFTLKVVDDENVESGTGVSRIITVKKPSAKFTAPRLVEVNKEFILNITESKPSEYTLDSSTTSLSIDTTLSYQWIITDSQGKIIPNVLVDNQTQPLSQPKLKFTNPGVYNVTLAVVDKYGLYQKTPSIQLNVENMPQNIANLSLSPQGKEGFTKIDKDGVFLPKDTSLSFEGGIAIGDKGTFSIDQKTAKSGDEFRLRARISSSSTQAEPVDLLLVVGIERQLPYVGDTVSSPEGKSIDPIYYQYDKTGIVVDDSGSPQELNLYGQPAVWIPQLTISPFVKQVSLTSNGLLVGLDGPLQGKGKYYFFIGYVKIDGTIVYSPVPMTVEVAD